jgi:hypothetical protein
MCLVCGAITQNPANCAVTGCSANLWTQSFNTAMMTLSPVLGAIYLSANNLWKKITLKKKNLKN